MRRQREQQSGGTAVDESENGEETQEQAVGSIKSDLIQEGENSDMLELESVINSIDDAKATVRLFEMGEFGSRQYLCEMPVTNFSLEYVKQEFGGGQYYAQFLTGTRKFYKKVQFEIAGLFQGRARKKDSPANPVATGQPGGGMDSNTLMAMMERQKSDSEKFFMLMLQMQQENSKNMMMVMGKMFEGGRNGPMRPGYEGQATVIEALTPLLLENVRMKGAGGGGGLLDNVDNLLKLKELFASNNEAEKEDMLEKLLKYGGPVLAGLMGGRAPVAQPGPRPVSPAQVTAPPAQSEITQANNMLRLAFPILIKAARNGSAPETYYEFMCDTMPQHVDELTTILERDDWCKLLFNDAPEITGNEKVKAWFEELRQLFIAEDEPEAEPAPGTMGG